MGLWMWLIVSEVVRYLVLIPSVSHDTMNVNEMDSLTNWCEGLSILINSVGIANNKSMSKE